MTHTCEGDLPNATSNFSHFGALSFEKMEKEKVLDFGPRG